MWGFFGCKGKVEANGSYSSAPLWSYTDLELQSTSGVPWAEEDPNSE